jgi:hypothetical protein
MVKKKERSVSIREFHLSFNWYRLFLSENIFIIKKKKVITSLESALANGLDNGR